MNDLRSSKQDERMEEMLEMLESMEKELTQKDSIIQQRDSEIRTLQGKLNELLNLCEKLNSENKAENVQALKNELKQTKELLQSEKEKKKRADSTIEECQDKLRQAEREKEYALTHQKKVEIPVVKSRYSTKGVGIATARHISRRKSGMSIKGMDWKRRIR